MKTRLFIRNDSKPIHVFAFYRIVKKIFFASGELGINHHGRNAALTDFVSVFRLLDKDIRIIEDGFGSEHTYVIPCFYEKMHILDIGAKGILQVKKDFAGFDFFLPLIVFKHSTDKFRLKAALFHLVIARIRCF